MTGLFSRITLFFLALSAPTVGAATLTGANCQHALTVVGTEVPETTWRTKNTYRNSDGALFATDTDRENAMEDRQRDDILSVTTQNFTPGIAIFPMTGVVTKNVTPQGSYLERVEVSGPAVADGILRATITLPVSGHNGPQMAAKWKDTDTYDLWMADSQGKTTFLAKGAKSLDYITFQEISIPLEKDKMVKVYYSRTGSAGVGGYPDGRTREFIWK